MSTEEENVLHSLQGYYEIWSPFDTPDAAEELIKMLEEKRSESED